MNATPLKILLVDDSESDSALLRESLDEFSPGAFEFVHVGRWTEAREQLRRHPFDLLLLDLSLPDVSGRDTFRRARAEAPHLPIVVLTAETSEEMGIEAVRHGVQDYLLKSQAYGRETARAFRYAIERKQVEDTLKRTEETLRERERQLREWNQELERRVAERTASLAETISDLEDFSHSITHDLRAPLRAIRSFAQMLGEECHACSHGPAQEHIRRITNAAARMDKLIQDMLQYSRLARSELRLTRVDVDFLLRGILESYPALQGPRVEIQIQGPLPQVMANEAALTQCFSNLLENAVKFVAPDTRPLVRVWAEPSPEPGLAAAPAGADPGTPAARPRVRFWVVDNGVGIPKEAQDRIFKMFQRLNKSYEGTGVGLTVVRKAVEKMGGKVGLESEPGQGSRFWIDLPAAEPKGTPGAP